MALDERAFFTERPEQRGGRYTCPRCRRVNDYQLRWVRRTKKDRPPANADADDKAKFAKLRDHLIRVDDELTCKTCGKRFEIPSMHSLVFVDQIEGLPRVEDEDEAAAGPAASASTPPVPSASGPGGSTPGTPAPRQRKGYAPPKAWR
ncbi:MAG: hypothetical protein AB7H93_13170 [Vicinamibacterales bacterium]